jgi:hypothetical protein
MWFVAYGPVGEEIVTKARKDDQLFVDAVAQTMMGSSSAYDHTFIITGFVLGAKKGSPDSPTTQAGILYWFALHPCRTCRRRRNSRASSRKCMRL